MADDSEKTEQPTPKRRREAREKGQVLKSKEVNTAALVLMSAYSLSWFGPRIYERILRLFARTFEDLVPYHQITHQWAVKTFVTAVIYLVGTVIPIFLAIYITAALVELLQVGILFSTKALKPDLNKVNPIKGFKRVFSLKSLVELVKGLVKTLIIGYIVYTVLRDNINYIIQRLGQDIASSFELVGFLVLTIAKKVAGAMIIIAGVDYFYQRWEFEKSLRMSKQEVKDEYKQTEGDPLIKGKQRQKQRQIAMGQVRQAVPGSDAVVSNPVHYAIAVRYKPQEDEAPLVTTKGEDHMAILIKELAEKHDVPIFEDPELARAMYPLCIVDKTIPPEFFQAVAEIIAKLMQKKQQKSFIDALNKMTGKAAKEKKLEESRNAFPTDGQDNNQPPTQSGPSSIFD